ncbi:MAG: hypothetical protein Q9219_000901 [cf. Caloplaca sp. 3 TL-2023]
MGDGWTGPGARTSPMNEEANQTYEAIKAQIKWQEQQRKAEENASRAARGLPPLKERKESFGTKAMKGLKKLL